MTEADPFPPPNERDWYLQEWMVVLKKQQADIIRDLGWERGRTSKVYNGKQAYTRDDLRALATWLGLKIHELLLPPAEVFKLRKLQAAIHTLNEEAAVFERPATAGEPAPPKTGGSSKR